MLLLDFLYELVGENEFIQVWDCGKGKYIYKGKRSDIGRFYRENNCRDYRYYDVVDVTAFSQDDKIGLCISIDKRR